MYRYDLLDSTHQATRADSLIKIVLSREANPTSVKTNYTTTFDLNSYVDWTTNIDSCYASNVSLCDDEACATLSTGTDAYLSANPTNKDSLGIVIPVLNIDRRTAF